MNQIEIEKFKDKANTILNIYFDFKENKNVAVWIFENFYPTKVKMPIQEVFNHIKTNEINNLEFNVKNGMITIKTENLYIATFLKILGEDLKLDLDELINNIPLGTKKNLKLINFLLENYLKYGDTQDLIEKIYGIKLSSVKNLDIKKRVVAQDFEKVQEILINQVQVKEDKKILEFLKISKNNGEIKV